MGDNPYLSGWSPCLTHNGKDLTISWKIYDDSTDTTGLGRCSEWKQYIRASGSAPVHTQLEEAWYDGAASVSAMRHVLEKNKEYRLPDDGKLIIDDAGNYAIEDKDAKVTYRANRIREFSPHLNASELLGQFVEYVRSLGVNQKDTLGLPIELFINWLIIEAAERDGDQIPETVVPPQQHETLKLVLKPKCLSCGRFIPKLHQQHRFPFCDPDHALRHARKHLKRISV